jgi:hypothetical protein
VQQLHARREGSELHAGHARQAFFFRKGRVGMGVRMRPRARRPDASRSVS